MEMKQANYVPCGCKAILSEKDPRASIWKAVFGKLEFPLKSPIAHYGQAEGESPTAFLMGDWEALSEDQKSRLFQEMEKKFGVNTKDFQIQVKQLGYIPIKDEHIAVLACDLHFRCML